MDKRPWEFRASLALFSTVLSRKGILQGMAGWGRGEPLTPRAYAHTSPPPISTPFRRATTERGNGGTGARGCPPSLARFPSTQNPGGVTGSLDGGAGATTWRPNPRDGGMGSGEPICPARFSRAYVLPPSQPRSAGQPRNGETGERGCPPHFDATPSTLNPSRGKNKPPTPGVPGREYPAFTPVYRSRHPAGGVHEDAPCVPRRRGNMSRHGFPGMDLIPPGAGDRDQRRRISRASRRISAWGLGSRTVESLIITS